MPIQPSAFEIRKTFLDFFVEHGHTLVPSASLVPGGDATLLFTNAGMVQFKDVFLGTDKREYRRATDSQKCMRVAGKHNDLEDVGKDDTHHTFFEMLGNWSFGDYYKKEAIAFAWQLLTEVWNLPKSQLYATCFKDDKGSIPSDEEAASNWRIQPGMIPDHVMFFGRKDNFWEMAETGPCGPCSEIHMDRGIEFCNMKDIEGHVCSVNGECTRFLELWNLVFIQYNRKSPSQLDSLPETHVDTGMGFERIVSVLQNVDSNYKTDLFKPALEVIRSLTNESETQMLENFTPYRVIADHARAAAFLIADGVVPGNTGRNYICRMIIRRAARFGTKLGLHEAFLAQVSNAFVDTYSDFFSDLGRNRQSIIENITREEQRFAKTIESGTAVLEGYLESMKKDKNNILSGEKAFELYATYGLPFEITRDISSEQSLQVDETGFKLAMDNHRLASGGGKAMGEQGGEDARLYSTLLDGFQADGLIGTDGIIHDPYQTSPVQGNLLAIVEDGQFVNEALSGSLVSVVVPRTNFYIESGGQVSDTGFIRDAKGTWEIEVHEMRKPAPGMIVHIGEVNFGKPKLNDEVIILMDIDRRMDIMRNHTATHLLHAGLKKVLGGFVNQAGSLVAPDKLRFDFNNNEGLTSGQLEEIEKGVNEIIMKDLPVKSATIARAEAIAEGAMALFGEKYGEIVRTISIGENNIDGKFSTRVSYELCGGTHLTHTGTIGTFIITGESSVSAGVRRIEAITGRTANLLISRRFKDFRQLTKILSSTPEDLVGKTSSLLDELNSARRQTALLKSTQVVDKFLEQIINAPTIKEIRVLVTRLEDVEIETMRNLCDQFRQKYPSGIIVIGTVLNDRPLVISAVTEDVVSRGIRAGDIVKSIAEKLGGSGGGKPTLAQAGGKDPSLLDEALQNVFKYIEANL